jgi:hypothetical protein
MTSPDEPQETQPEGQPQDHSRPLAATRAAGLLRRHWIWVALTAAVALAGFAAVNIPGSGNAFPAAAGAHVSAPPAAGSPRGGASPNPDATEPIPAAVPSPAGVAAASSSHLPRRLAASLARWKAGRGGATLAVLTLQVSTATQAAGLKLYAMMKMACTKVGSAVTAARAGPPIPDAAMQGRYAKALATLIKAAADCRAGISVRPDGDETLQVREHPKALSASRSEFGTGAADLFLATAKIRALGQH